MYSSEYTSGFSEPAASHLAASPSPRHEGNVGQAPRRPVGGRVQPALFMTVRRKSARKRVPREAYLVGDKSVWLMAYSWWQRRPLSIPDHTLLAIRHMLFSSDELGTTLHAEGHLNPIGFYGNQNRFS